MEETQITETVIRRVKVLEGAPKQIAIDQGLKDEDLVLVTTGEYHSEPEYEVEKINGDPFDFIFKAKAKN